VVTKTTDNDYAAANQGSRVKICGRKHLDWIAEDINLAVWMTNHHIIVDVKIWIIVVLVLSSDQHRATIREFS